MNKLFLFSVACSTIVLSGCGGVKEKLGLDRHSPDEFAVIHRAPLEIPSDLTILPMPQLGLQRPQDISAKQQAEKVVLGDSGINVSEKASSAEESLLQKANANGNNKNIRAQLAKEGSQEQKDKRPVIKKLLSVGDSDPSATVVDAKAEAKRIQDAKAAGKLITTGETPVIEE